jgi:hypothetical protein
MHDPLQDAYQEILQPSKKEIYKKKKKKKTFSADALSSNSQKQNPAG